jgi:DNA polymerase-3 subunit delta'
MSFGDIIGQEIAKEILQKDITKERVPSSYLFVGPKGVGKKLTAINLAKAVNCYKKGANPCDECVNCRLIDKGNFPDCIIVSPDEKGNIKIERIREIKQTVSFRTMGRRVIIIEDADTMTEEAQNAFLKTLEEPPLDTTIILTSSKPYYLFQTIISRCKIVKFRRLSRLNVEKLLKTRGIKNSELLANLSGGSMERALSLSEFDVRKTAFKFANLTVKERLSTIGTLRNTPIEEFLNPLYILYGDMLIQHFGLQVRNTDFKIADKELSHTLKGMSIIRQAVLALNYNVNSDNILYYLAYNLPEMD